LGVNGAFLASKNKEQFTVKQKELRALVPHWEALSFSSIAKKLNQMNISTPQGHLFCASTAQRYFSAPND
jgi:hypothetical protein